MKTLSGIVHSYTDTLVTRAADVVLKEGRKLVLGVRETPLHLGHLRLMTQAAEIGAVIMPPVPAFYHRPQTLDDVINQTVNRVCLRFIISRKRCRILLTRRSTVCSISLILHYRKIYLPAGAGRKIPALHSRNLNHPAVCFRPGSALIVRRTVQ